MAGRILPIDRVSLEKKRPRNRRPIHQGKDPGYLAWLHRLPCCVTMSRDQLVAHHPTVGRGRAARKEDDATAVPVTEAYHSDQYATGLHRGEAKFWNLHGIDPTALADDLYAAYKKGMSPELAVEIILAHRALAGVRVVFGIKVFDGREK